MLLYDHSKPFHHFLATALQLRLNDYKSLTSINHRVLYKKMESNFVYIYYIYIYIYIYIYAFISVLLEIVLHYL